jgi:hypothetical protein
MSGTMNSQDLFIGTLQGIHPFNFKLPLNCSNDNLLSSLVQRQARATRRCSW